MDNEVRQLPLLIVHLLVVFGIGQTHAKHLGGRVGFRGSDRGTQGCYPGCEICVTHRGKDGEPLLLIGHPAELESKAPWGLLGAGKVGQLPLREGHLVDQPNALSAPTSAGVSATRSVHPRRSARTFRSP